MLKKNYRLRKDIAFSATFRLKNCKSNQYMTLYKGKDKNSDDIPTKVVFVVSKKIHKRAVKRNKIKRRLREAYQWALKNNKIDNLQTALSLVFIVKSNILDSGLETVKLSMQQLAQKF